MGEDPSSESQGSNWSPMSFAWAFIYIFGTLVASVTFLAILGVAIKALTTYTAMSF